jgi:glycosyltransferase involved in cell wall biosynthesis
MINAGCPEKRINVIQHGIDHKLFNPNADGIYFRKKFGVEEFLLFGYIGRLRLKSTTQSKNLMALLQAAKIVTDSVPNSRLALAGAGYEEEMKPVVDKMGLNKKVIYVGNIPYQENSRFLRMCDLIVCPAAADGFCFLLAQASACGIPVVATNVAAHKERVIHMKTGLLVGLSAADIAKSILQLLKDRDMNKSFGAAGYVSVQNLSWDKSAKKHLEVYERLISNST